MRVPYGKVQERHAWNSRQGGFAALALGAAIAGALIVAFAPLVHGVEGSTTPAGEPLVRTFRTTIVSHEGLWVLGLVTAPVMVALIGLVGRRRTWVLGLSAVLLWAFSLVSIWSVGLYFVPAAILMTIAAAGSRRYSSVMGTAGRGA